MIQRDTSGELFCSCDGGCEGDEWAGTLEFREFVAFLKSQGWEMNKSGDEWQHVCPTCAGNA